MKNILLFSFFNLVIPGISIYCLILLTILAVKEIKALDIYIRKNSKE